MYRKGLQYKHARRVDSLPSVIPQLAGVRVTTPIEQHMLGRSGLFRQQNIEKRKIMSVREWAELCSKDDFRALGIDDIGLRIAVDSANENKRRSKRRGSNVNAPRGSTDDIADVKVEDDEVQLLNIERRGGVDIGDEGKCSS